MEAPKITDYSSFAYQLPQQPTDKDYEKLSSKLKTFVQSSKFLREGSTIDQYDPETGKRVKRPVSNVVYKESPQDQEGLPAQQLRQLINRGVRQQDRKALQQASKYQFYSADKFITQKERAKEDDKKKRKRIILTSLALGVPLGAVLSTVPFSNARLMNEELTPQHYTNAAKLAALGLLIGTGTTALIEGTRE